MLWMGAPGDWQKRHGEGVANRTGPNDVAMQNDLRRRRHLVEYYRDLSDRCGQCGMVGNASAGDGWG
jgi:hypothetical protein